ncbi:MAG: hypothetical protein ACXU8N_13840 [Telluria sp.]
MNQRRGIDRRRDKSKEERLDLALKTWRAFDRRAAEAFLILSGLDRRLIDSFLDRCPHTLRGVRSDGRSHERRQYLDAAALPRPSA